MDFIFPNCDIVFSVVSCSSPKTFFWISKAFSRCSKADLKSFFNDQAVAKVNMGPRGIMMFSQQLDSQF